MQNGKTKQVELEKQMGVTSQKHQLPALYSFISRDGQVIALQATGYRDLEARVLATSDDVLRLGSNSKTVSCTLIAVLVDHGIISWNTRIRSVFPELDKKYPESVALDATVLQLTSHRGGVNRQYKMYSEQAKLGPTTWRRKYLESCLADKASVAPGSKHIYGPGVTLAVAMAERLSGKPFEELMNEYLCKPLAIHSFAMGTGSKTTPVGYWLRNGEISKAPPFNSYLTNCPTTGICLSMTDLAKIFALRAGSGDGANLLSNDTRRILNSSPYNDGVEPGLFSEQDSSGSWFGHAGNTGCGDWSKVSFSSSWRTICFFHTNLNRPGNDPQPPLDYKDYLLTLRALSLR